MRTDGEPKKKNRLMNDFLFYLHTILRVIQTLVCAHLNAKN